MRKTDGSTGVGSDDSISGIRSNDENGEGGDEESGNESDSDVDDTGLGVNEIIVGDREA